jgi:thiamine-phosphate pyrophosphorylase
LEALKNAVFLAREWTGEATVDSKAALIALVRTDAELCATLERQGLRLDMLNEQAVLLHGIPPSLQETIQLAEFTEHQVTARVLDAGANRAREAIRVVEDYCRFVLGDVFLTRQCKELRHDLTAALLAHGPDNLLHGRDTQQDVGATLSSAAERERSGLFDVACANLKRMQEALRSLEEFGKVHDSKLGQAIERLRYKSYTLERVLLLGKESRQRLADARLYVLLSGSSCTGRLGWTIDELAAGGAHVIQLREKRLADRDLLERAREVRHWTRKVGLLFILNDRPDIARLAEADGVHLGQNDLGVYEARRILGTQALIGVSTHNLNQLRQAVLDGANYLGVGPMFPSQTKMFTEFPGLDFLKTALQETTLPIFPIGGINEGTVAAVAAAGAPRVAVGHALASAEDPRTAAASFLKALSR